MKVAFDIDDVIFDTFFSLKTKILNLFKIDVGDPRRFSLTHIYGLSDEMVQIAVIDALSEWENLIPIPGAIEYIKDNYSNKDVNFITSRDINLKSKTEELLDFWLRCYNIDYTVLYTNGSKYTKSQFAIAENVDIFVEDRVKHAIDLSTSGIHVLLMDKSWNRKDLSEFNKIRRVKDWMEINNEISAICSDNGNLRS